MAKETCYQNTKWFLLIMSLIVVIKGIADKEDLHLSEKEIQHEAVRTISHYLAKPLFEELCKALE